MQGVAVATRDRGASGERGAGAIRPRHALADQREQAVGAFGLAERGVAAGIQCGAQHLFVALDAEAQNMGLSTSATAMIWREKKKAENPDG